MSSSVLTEEAIPTSTVELGAPGTRGSVRTRVLRYAVLAVFVLLVLYLARGWRGVAKSGFAA